MFGSNEGGGGEAVCVEMLEEMLEAVYEVYEELSYKAAKDGGVLESGNGGDRSSKAVYGGEAVCVGEKSEAMRGKMVYLAEEEKFTDKISIVENVGNPLC